MIRAIVFIVVVCVGLAVALTRCAPERQGTLTLNPAPDFPADKKQELGRGVARILPKCPGLGRYGDQLVFNSLSSGAGGLAIVFSVPPGASLPAEWGRPEKPCAYVVTSDSLNIEGAFCQTLCLGRAPESEASAMVIDLLK